MARWRQQGLKTRFILLPVLMVLSLLALNREKRPIAGEDLERPLASNRWWSAITGAGCT
jgi:hypothetical protein